MHGNAQTVKDAITMGQVFRQYGFSPNRAGFICCPFHSEKTASLGIYADGKRWKCFGCGAGGDVIGFVQQLFGLTFAQAVTRLCADFGLCAVQDGKLSDDAFKRELQAKRAQETRELEAYREEWTAHFRAFMTHDEALQWCRPLVNGEPMLPCYAQAMRWIDYEWDWLCAHPWK